ncbi:MAG TPA: glutamine--fructose-6-phosphate transaminase (isomerizing) [Bdellovibrionales bacterium]|nr:glutamine--fructose-6-phosphate transaminase (isomerizing) [Bdellovibrionales bacterium]|tara:strand:+ start:17335 stop:19173 length:1839 start_codon:yes stop_codon:yes gene_type:complete
MCGIVGYLGSKDPKSVLIEGLRALEYRGYDSAGVAILNDGHFKRVRAEGKLAKLSEKLAHEKFSGRLGIAHTRWATHGPPVEKNAHPHHHDGVVLVHNGIIENYVDLKNELRTRGATFESDTDSELVVHLIAEEVKRTKDLFEAVKNILPRLEGAYSIVAVWDQQPDRFVAFKKGPPLIFGEGKDEMIVASDVQAIVSHTKKILHLEDEQILLVSQGEFHLFDRSGKPLPVHMKEISWSAEKAEKGGHPHFMLKEIFEQPRAVAQALDAHVDLSHPSVHLKFGGNKQMALEDLSKFERIFIVACGTSFYAGLVGEYMIERLAGLPVECDIASEFRYRYPVLPKNSLFISISQSGETADTLAAVRLAKESGAKVLSICNVPDSSIDREAHASLHMCAGIEVGVASTKAFTATLTLMSLLALQVAKLRDRLSAEDEKNYVEELIGTPSRMETVLAFDSYFEEASETLKENKGFLYLGRGVHFPVALEGALKLKELAYMHAEGYAAGEMKHGPLALIDEKMAVVVLSPKDELYEKTLSNLEEARARGGKIISIGSHGDGRLEELSEHYLALPEASWFTLPLLEVIPLQLLSYHVAASLGHDVDQPRNLAKSVTVE